jgi:hypothetical protein
MKVYYEFLLKLANCSHVKATYVFITIVLITSLLPYLQLTIVGIKWNTWIKHKEVVVVYKENGHVSVSYNVLLTTLKINIIVYL